MPKKTIKSKKKTVKVKTAAKAKTIKKVSAKKPAAAATAKVNFKKAVAALKVVKSPMTKSQIMTTLSEITTLSKTEVVHVIDALGHVIAAHVKKGAVGKFSLPGMIKIEVKKRPATKARKGRNPFTGEEIMIQAKPARKVVKVKPLKTLKEMAD